MSNYSKAQALAHDAEMLGQVEDAQISAMNAQTHALLAVADAIAAAKPEPTERTRFVIAKSVTDATFQFQAHKGFFTKEEAEDIYNEIGKPIDQTIYRIDMEVVQS